MARSMSRLFATNMRRPTRQWVARWAYESPRGYFSAAPLQILLARRRVLAERRLEFGLERGESLEPRGCVEETRGPAWLR